MLHLLVGRTTYGSRNHYIVSRDGQRFLVNSAVGEVTSRPLTIILNWAADLRR